MCTFNIWLMILVFMISINYPCYVNNVLAFIHRKKVNLSSFQIYPWIMFIIHQYPTRLCRCKYRENKIYHLHIKQSHFKNESKRKKEQLVHSIHLGRYPDRVHLYKTRLPSRKMCRRINRTSPKHQRNATQTSCVCYNGVVC